MPVFNVFYEGRLDEYLAGISKSINDTIGREAEDYILNVNEDEYARHLLERFDPEQPSVDFDGVEVTSIERMVRAEDFPNSYNVRRGASYPKQAIVYHLPIEGDIDLFRYQPNPSLLWTEEVTIIDGSMKFEILSLNESKDEIKNEAEHIMLNLRTQLAHVLRDVDGFKRGLENSIKSMIQARKQHFLDKQSLLNSLGVPVRKRSDLPQTFTVPPPKTRKSLTLLRPKPDAAQPADPTLDDTTYNQILGNIFDVGKVFERLPSMYAGKGEEDLRDQILLYLEPHFEGTGGETFNAAGKTDILIRWQNNTVFIAECKIWHGQKQYLEAIDQLLSYLTWRDSKAAIILFVRNRDLSTVIQAIEEATPTHPNFAEGKGKSDETVLRYEIHFAGDVNKRIKLAVMLFHIPE